MFCSKCGNQIMDGELFCANCGCAVEAEDASLHTAAVETQMTVPVEPMVVPGQVNNEEKKKTNKGALVGIIAGVTVLFFLVAGLMVYAGYAMVKTKGFKEEVASFKAVEKASAGLGEYKKDFNTLVETSEDAASGLRFWEYEELVERMDKIAEDIELMNESVAEYRVQYEAVVQAVEADSRYVMEDFREEYQELKDEIEAALADFDEKEAEDKVEEFAEFQDKIIEANKEMAADCIDEAEIIQSSFSGYSAHPFETYMISDFMDKMKSDKEAQDYIQLQEDYIQLKEWSDRFEGASRAGEQISSFVQADVSAADEVKLYLNSNNYTDYDFVLEDFIIYEQKDEEWYPCNPINISQINGSLTMDLVVDISGSMRMDFYAMQQAVEGFVNYTHSDTVLGLSTIGSIYERYQEFTTDKNSIINSAWNLECYGLTSLYQSLYSSVIYTASASGARCVVAFTDGYNEPYGSGYDYDAQDVIDVSKYYQVPVYIIGIGGYVYSNELREIAESTGGAFYDDVSIYDLQALYTDIYVNQGKLYELSYETEVPNNMDRDIYVLYADNTQNLSVRLESELKAEALQQAYETATYSADNLAAYYTDSKYLSSDDLAKLGEDLEAVQTVINIYYAKNGYKFGDGENGQKQLAKMISLGVITENGTLDGDTVSAILKSNTVVYQNFSALYNFRYELIYSAAYNIYWNNPSITYEELRSQVHQYYGETNEKRFDPVTKAAWNAIKNA